MSGLWITNGAPDGNPRWKYGRKILGMFELSDMHEDSAVPITPYSNAPLKDDPSVESVIRQRVPLEYQDILR